QQDLHLLPLLRTSEQEQQLQQPAQKPISERKALKWDRSSTHARTLRADRLGAHRQERYTIARTTREITASSPSQNADRTERTSNWDRQDPQIEGWADGAGRGYSAAQVSRTRGI